VMSTTIPLKDSTTSTLYPGAL